MARNSLILALSILALPPFAAARDLGTYGPLFPVEEPSMLEAIESRLQEMEEAGAFDELKEEMENAVRSYVDRPRSGVALPRASEDRYFDVDLSITLDRNLADHRGVVFARAGDRINPLDYSIFNKRIVVLDGDDPAQVRWAIEYGDELDTLLVIMNGRPLALTKEFGRRFYFDQDGTITHKFQLAALPAQIIRGDGVMKVHEVLLGDY